jgi:hypothetical protein
MKGNFFLIILIPNTRNFKKNVGALLQLMAALDLFFFFEVMKIVEITHDSGSLWERLIVSFQMKFCTII